MLSSRYTVPLNDLEREILRVDREVLEIHKHPPPLVLQLPDATRNDYDRDGQSIGELVSFIPVPQPSIYDAATQKPITKKQSVDTYVIWREPAVRWLEGILEGRWFSKGQGYSAIKERWFLMAVALVRTRILFHPKWFPDMPVRTKESLMKHRNLFADPGDDLSGLRILRKEFLNSEEKLEHDPMMLDIHWTLQLIAQAIEHGAPPNRALSLLYSDEY